ncbi:MAG: glycosyltransferase family 2 protein [bacterium]
MRPSVSLESPPISIIICTRNRAESLRETLGSILRCAVTEGESVEIVVVDNGSRDHTRAVVIELAGHASVAHGRFELRYVVESALGQARARNRGMTEARGAVFLWTDDDVRVPTSWIQEMTRPLLSGEADAVAGEVMIPPHLAGLTRSTPLERWLFLVASSCNINFAAPESMVGANMAFARTVLLHVPNFDVALGPGPESLGFFDETLFCRRLRDAGLKLVGVPGAGAAVQHHFDPSRLEPKQLIDSCFRMGRSEAYCDRASGHDKQVRHPRLARLIAEMRFAAWRLRAVLLQRPTDARVELRMRRAWQVGYLKQACLQRRAQTT